MSFLGRQLNLIARKSYILSEFNKSLGSLSLTQNRILRTQPQVKILNENVIKQSNIISNEQDEVRNIFGKVKEQLYAEKEGRLFAVISLCGKQFKVTAGDIILVEGYWPPTIGDEILMNKVLLVGAKDFTMIGTPLLDNNLVNIRATVIEKTLAHTKIHFKKKRRKQYMRTNFQRSPNTMIRINTITITTTQVDHCEKNLKNEKQIF